MLRCERSEPRSTRRAPQDDERREGKGIHLAKNARILNEMDSLPLTSFASSDVRPGMTRLVGRKVYRNNCRYKSSQCLRFFSTISGVAIRVLSPFAAGSNFGFSGNTSERAGI